MGEAIAKLHISMAFLGQTEVRDNEFCFLWIEFQFYTIHPPLNTGETFIELCSYDQVLDIVGCQQHIDGR